MIDATQAVMRMNAGDANPSQEANVQPHEVVNGSSDSSNA